MTDYSFDYGDSRWTIHRLEHLRRLIRRVPARLARAEFFAAGRLRPRGNSWLTSSTAVLFVARAASASSRSRSMHDILEHHGVEVVVFHRHVHNYSEAPARDASAEKHGRPTGYFRAGAPTRYDEDFEIEQALDRLTDTTPRRILHRHGTSSPAPYDPDKTRAACRRGRPVTTKLVSSMYLFRMVNIKGLEAHPAPEFSETERARSRVS